MNKNNNSDLQRVLENPFDVRPRRRREIYEGNAHYIDFIGLKGETRHHAVITYINNIKQVVYEGTREQCIIYLNKYKRISKIVDDVFDDGVIDNILK